MTTYIALLRGINVGGHKAVAMADLRAMLTELGFADGRSLLQSGNLVFRATGVTSAGLERVLEQEVERRLGLRTDFLVRSAQDWKGVIADNPFPDEASRDPGRLIVIPLKDRPSDEAIEALRACIVGPEVVRAGKRQIYVVYPNGAGSSRFTLALIERKLGTRGTGRNWNTVVKLGGLCGG